MDDMVIVAWLRALTELINECNMRCYIILRAYENRVIEPWREGKSGGSCPIAPYLFFAPLQT